jgi:hypothetical protein
MDDPEKGETATNRDLSCILTVLSVIIEQMTDNPADEAAAAKLWAVYVSEAEKYDRGLVESWKSDMEVVLLAESCHSAI